MDSLTQIVLGAAIGELVLGRKVGNKAILWGAIAGTIPDLDVLCRTFFDDLRANELHRGITHSILFSLVMAPILGHWIKRHQASLLAVFTALVALVFFFGAGTGMAQVIIGVVALGVIALILWKVKGTDTATPKEWSWLFWWTLVTHPLLDCHTTWGTQLFWPFSLKVAYNNVFVVDPGYTVPLLVCVAIALFLKRTSTRRRWINGLGLVLSSAYMMLTLVCKYIAHERITASLNRQGITYSSLSTRPTPFNCILWSATAVSDDHYDLTYYSLLDSKPEVEFVRFPKNRELLGRWADDQHVHRLIRLSADNYVMQRRNDTLVFCDLRFGQIGEPAPDKPFIFSYKLIPVGDELRVVLIPPPALDGEKFSTLTAELWARVKGE
ncbi:MAG: metal-dependent hydrolase [Flavobacteriales bacterium]|nr:metal-dependent hydrolase [Flavobacteriales bacterium]